MGELAGLISSICADVVIGTESWLDATIMDNEVFPRSFNVYRHDRMTHGGGVFILVRDS